jgi:hypothetical protein
MSVLVLVGQNEPMGLIFRIIKIETGSETVLISFSRSATGGSL